MINNNEVEKWCPTQGGVYIAYQAEWLALTNPEDGDIWQRIKTVRGRSYKNINGVPQPLFNGGINETIGLYGYEQAQALAWWFAAQAAEVGENIKVRIQAYEVVFDIKARKIDLN